MRRSWRAASATAAAKASGALTLLMPTLEPRLAGFTKQGNPIWAATAASTVAGAAAHSCRFSDRYGTTGRPWARNMSFMATLSMPSAEPSTPAPT